MTATSADAVERLADDMLRPAGQALLRYEAATTLRALLAERDAADADVAMWKQRALDREQDRDAARAEAARLLEALEWIADGGRPATGRNPQVMRDMAIAVLAGDAAP